jgi:hypothetical protein
MADYIDYDLESVGISSNVFRVSYVDILINGKEIEFVVTSNIDGDVDIEVCDSNIVYLRENLPDVEFSANTRTDTFSVKTESFVDYVHDFVTEAMNNGEID